ncbi:MAG: UTRA domain-containing protein, partial [Chloroflexi bacterium]|nr:UTRA domain-containing protein [Chloroflexota bacterium]
SPTMYLEDFVIADEENEKDMLSYPGSILTYLIEQKDPPLAYARTKIFSVSANALIAEKLSVKEGEPVLHLVEKMYNTVGDLISLTKMYVLTDQFYFSVTRRIPPR